MHGLRLPLGALLIVRAFELWTHENDIRRVAGLPASVPDAPTLRLMTDLAARLLPHAASLTGLDEPTSLRLVLTGPGGGAWDVMIGEDPPGAVPIRIVADAAGLSGWPQTVSRPPSSTCMSRAIPAGPPGSWPPHRRSRSTRTGHIRAAW